MVMDSATVDSLLDYVGFQKVEVQPDFTIRKMHPGVVLDFNAIAQGYTIDRLAAVLDRKGVDNYLVEVGGELIGKGVNLLKEQPWVVGINDPQLEEGRSLKLKVQLKDRALASSGNYRKFRIDSISGRKYVHTIDPISGFTKDSNVLAVSVLANSCAVADAYATAFMAMDLDESIKLLVAQKELEAYIIYLDEEGNTKEFMTTGFREIILE
jgi:thiamine biosynthesis lipoprotein